MSRGVPDARLAEVEAAVARASHLLPGQGPLSVFIHHNTLHAFEHLPFHDAVAAASRLYETEPYFGEARFRDLMRSGRITEKDLERALECRWAERPPGAAGRVDGRLLERLAMLHSIDVEPAPTLAWRLEDGDALRRIREDAPPASRRALLARAADEKEALVDLWRECLALPIACSPPAPQPAPPFRSLGDRLRDATGEDPDELVTPVVVRLAAAFLDDDSASWAMPDRDRGFFAAWAGLLEAGGAPLPVWLRGLREEAHRFGTGPEASTRVVAAILDDLGVTGASREEFLARVLLRLRGWGGMFHWLESHSVGRLGSSRPVRLMDFLAVRLTYDRRAWAFLARKHFPASPSLARLALDLAAAARRAEALPVRPAEDGAWRLFQLAQLLGIDAGALSRLGAGERAAMVDRLDGFPSIERRRVWQEAYEAHFRDEFLDALAANVRRPLASRCVAQARFQVVCCIDDREESLRRHLEEIEPSTATFGIAGYFGLAIRFTGVDDHGQVSLCPVAIEPSHSVLEVVADDEEEAVAHLRRRRRRRWHRWRHASRHASRTMARGSLATPLLGVVSAFALPARVLAPRLSADLRRAFVARVFPEPATRLLGARSEAESLDLPAAGFTVDEKADRLADAFRSMGLTAGFSRLVLLLGHGSGSVNNPHVSAYECGACGGRAGGTNARLFAELANRPHVRRALADRGIAIAEDTVFVGGVHDTCSDEVTLFDLDAVPPGHRADLAALRRVLDEARARSAHERCRRFASAPRSAGPREALRHVEVRSEALFEARPELGHCTNAVCVVGRREATRGLFLDRRCFLVSYDPEGDPGGAVLARTLSAVVPVAGGINLEYFFSSVDPLGYGCGTKLPHNLVGMIGVMDGAASDLRTGLTRQMTELHEPMRLLLVVEAETSTLDAVAAGQAGLDRLFANEWIQLVSLSPATGRLSRRTPHGWVEEAGAPRRLARVARSSDWYAGHDGFLGPVVVAAAEVPDAA